MHKHTPLSVILFAITIILAQSVLAGANEEKAKMYFYGAEAGYEKGDYASARKALQDAKSLLGGTNARIITLEIKILYKQKAYAEAKRLIEEFYKYDSNESLKKEVGGLMVNIDAALDQQVRVERELQIQTARNRQLVANKTRELVQLINNQTINGSGSTSVAFPRASFSTGYRKVTDYVDLSASYEVTQTAKVTRDPCIVTVKYSESLSNDRVKHDGGDWGESSAGSRFSLALPSSENSLKIADLTKYSVKVKDIGMKVDRNPHDWIVKDTYYTIGGGWIMLIFNSRNDADVAKELIDFVVKWGDCRVR